MTRPKVIFPEYGLPEEEVLKMMKDFSKEDHNWEEGKIWGLVYHASDEHTNFLKKASEMFFSLNALSPIAFPSLKKFETEVVSMTIDLFNGDKKACGSMTSGGTESILMSIKTYRDWARVKFKNIKNPEMVIPSSAHPAFEKGAEYFNVKSIRVPVNEKTHRADVKAMEEAVTDNTILIVASACDYPRGIVDPITELGEIAQTHNIGLHVDSCLGGFMLPFLKKLGYDIPAFDFSIPGVTSISADIHKYGYAAKGASLILYRKERLWKHQFCVYTDWSGGVYISPSIRGTRPGGPIAAAWATLKSIGENGYLKIVEQVMDTTKKLIDGINQIPELHILGKPVMSVFSFASNELDVYKLADIMDNKGWNLDRLQFPPALHQMINPHHAKVVEPFLNDLRESVENLKENHGEIDEGVAALYGMVASIPNRKKAKEYLLNFVKDQYKVK